MKKAFILILFALTYGLKAQEIPYQKGEKTLSLGVNSIFSYFGNFFSKNDNFVNQFSIPINGNFVLRQFKTPTTAVRHQFSIGFNFTSPGSVQSGNSEKLISFNSTYLWGREKHIYLNRFNVYSFYGFGPRISYSSVERKFLSQIHNQKVSIIEGPSISALGTAGFGLEYRFSERFFIGAEASAQGFVSYSLINKNEIFDGSTNQVQKNENRNVINFSLFIVNPLIFRAGVRF